MTHLTPPGWGAAQNAKPTKNDRRQCKHVDELLGDFSRLITCHPNEFSVRYKRLRVEQNHRAYQQRRKLRLSPAEKFPLPVVCKAAKALAAIPLPQTFIFRSIASSPAFDGSEHDDARLEELSRNPPFTPATRGLPDEDTCDALHGWYLRQQRTYEDARNQRYITLERHAFLEELHAEMSRFHREFNELGTLIDTSHPDTNPVYLISLQWKARRFLSLYDDIQAVQTQPDTFISVYVERWMKLRI